MESDSIDLEGNSIMKLVLIILATILVTPAMPNSFRVGRRNHFNPLLRLAAAKSGDTIWVDEGTYYEKNLVVNKSIVLKGIGQPMLEVKKYEIITIKADNVTIDGFKLRRRFQYHDFAAIRISNCRDATIANNVITDAFFGYILNLVRIA
jgi:nitrous oxidase accessory protein